MNFSFLQRISKTATDVNPGKPELLYLPNTPFSGLPKDPHPHPAEWETSTIDIGLFDQKEYLCYQEALTVLATVVKAKKKKIPELKSFKTTMTHWRVLCDVAEGPLLLMEPGRLYRACHESPSHLVQQPQPK
ncbi:LOW QUALITY PROTEIN: hypothetical protein J0S82_007548, partial [Galemys pyrenaicus]